MNQKNYEDKVRGCWFGKCLGGIAGMPFEGVPFSPNITETDIHVKDVPNDDLEMQLVWLDGLKQHGLGLDAEKFGKIWLDRIPHGCDEYSVAIHNLKHGIMPPASGWKDNFFTCGMGAAIRSEIWALAFPGRSDAAGYYAQLDAQVDHWGDGVRGEIFMAMAESAACVTSDIEGSLRSALDRVDPETELHRTLAEVFRLYDAGKSEAEARDYILFHYGRHPNFTHCVMNLAFIVFALLYGKGDFIKTILLAVNCGRDTDCTGATCGAFLGIALGMKSMPGNWIPAVREALCLSDYVSCIPEVPLSFTELVKQTIAVHNRLFPKLEPEYPAYTPYVPDVKPPVVNRSQWLILTDSPDADAVAEEIRKTGKCPESRRGNIVEFDGFMLDLSPFAHEACTLDLISVLHMDNREVEPENIILSATSDVGQTLFIDGQRIMNHHSRLRMLPSFHRAEGGAAFAFPVRYGERKTFHIRLLYCLPPMRMCVMFANQFNDHLDGFNFRLDL